MVVFACAAALETVSWVAVRFLAAHGIVYELGMPADLEAYNTIRDPPLG